MKKSGLKRLIGNDYIFSVFVKIMMIIVGILHSAFLARFLGAEMKGMAATITSTVALLQVIATCGMHQAYPYFKKRGEIQDFLKKFINNVYFIYSFMFLAIFLLFLVFYSSIPEKTSFITLLTPIFAYETVVGYIYLIENPKERNLWNLISSFAETVIIILFWLFFEPNHPLMLIAVSASVIIRAIASTVGLGVHINVKQISFRFIGKMLRFGIMPMIALILTIMNSKIDILMMDANASVSSAEIGLYSVGIGVADKILAIPDAIRQILLSKLASGQSEQEVARVTRISVLLCTGMALGISLFGEIIINILFGKEFSGAYNVLIIASFGTVFMVFLKMISQYNIVNKKQFANMIMLGVSVVVNICFNLLLIPRYGIEGAAIASFVGHLVCAICFIVYFNIKTGIGLRYLILPQKEDFSVF